MERKTIALPSDRGLSSLLNICREKFFSFSLGRISKSEMLAANEALTKTRSGIQLKIFLFVLPFLILEVWFRHSTQVTAPVSLLFMLTVSIGVAIFLVFASVLKLAEKFSAEYVANISVSDARIDKTGHLGMYSAVRNGLLQFGNQIRDGYIKPFKTMVAQMSPEVAGQWKKSLEQAGEEFQKEHDVTPSSYDDIRRKYIDSRNKYLNRERENK
jgi:hypothetical protein